MKYTTKILFSGLGLLLATTPLLAYGRGVAVGGARVGPYGGSSSGYAARGYSAGPYGGAGTVSSRGGSYTTPGGTTVQHAGVEGAYRNPYGGAAVGGASGTRVTTPSGNTYTHTDRAGAAASPYGGVRVGGAESSSVRTPYGTAVGSTYRGGVAVGPYGGVQTRSVSGAAVRTPYGGAVVGHSTAYYSPTMMRSSATVVRTGWVSPAFTPGWYGVHTTAWVAPRWVAGYNIWVPPVWGTMAAFVGIAGTPIPYDYGSTVVIQNDNVYVNGAPTASAADYSAQASQLVDTGRNAQPASTDEWEPLGVFGLIQPNETVAQRIFQLAVNKSGVVRGNYYDAVADNTIDVVGSVDQKTQRVAWSIGKKKDIVFETGLSNFTKDESTVLVHYGQEKTEQMMLVRLPQPKDDKNGAAPKQ